MKVCVIHFHLNRGGVTRVIANQLLAMDQIAQRNGRQTLTEVVVFYGGRADGWNADLSQQISFPVELVALPFLDYDEIASECSDLAHAIRNSLHERGFTRDSTLLHIHNHSLGKKAAMPAAVEQLARDGWPVLLQIHDFAEDLRPQNYTHLLSGYDTPSQLQATLYPQASHIHYATLNGRDHSLMLAGGVPEERLHLLPNPVNPLAVSENVESARAKLIKRFQVPPDHRYVLYPVRAIGRKNLGEFLLWAAITNGVTFGISLRPKNPREAKGFNQWKRLSEELSLPVAFSTGEAGGLSLGENYAAADAIVTTSVAEGFGLVFLEAYLAGKPLFGRRLAGVVDDFESAGLRFPGLVSKMSIPADLIDVDVLQRSATLAGAKLRESFGLPNAKSSHDSEVPSQFSGETLDFGMLDFLAQAAIIKQLSRSQSDRERIRWLNPVVGKIEQDGDDQAAIIRANSNIIAKDYSLSEIGQKLQHVYQTVLDSPVGEVSVRPEIGQSVLDFFLQPSKLCLIRL